MRHLNITFEDFDFKNIEELKKESGHDWRTFIIVLANHAEDSIKKGNLKFIKK